MVLCVKARWYQQIDGLPDDFSLRVAEYLFCGLVEDSDPVAGIAGHDRIARNRQDAREFGFRSLKGKLRPLAISDVDVNTNHALCVPIAIVRYRISRLDPPHSTAQQKNAYSTLYSRCRSPKA
jgi:hypothetical protein